jgi:hypothetical protein
MVVGTKAQVGHGTADRTAGGLKKNDLFFDKADGRWKSQKQSTAGKKNPGLKKWRSALEKAGGLQDGQFKLITKGSAIYKEAKKIMKK